MVEIDLPFFKATAFGVYDMLGDDIVDIMMSQGPEKTVKLMTLLKLAILLPSKSDDFSLLSWNEQSETIEYWIGHSHFHKTGL